MVSQYDGQMAMLVANGTMCELVMYRINCTAYIYVMFTCLYFQGTYFF